MTTMSPPPCPIITGSAASTTWAPLPRHRPGDRQTRLPELEPVTRAMRGLDPVPAVEVVMTLLAGSGTGMRLGGDQAAVVQLTEFDGHVDGRAHRHGPR